MKLIARVLIALSLIGTSPALAQATAAPSQSSGVVSSVAITPGYYGRTTSGSGYGSALGFLRGSSRPVFVVPAGETALEDLLAANEDMTVMTRIFGHALEQANLGGGASNPFVSFLGQSSQSAPSVYLAGYGALTVGSECLPRWLWRAVHPECRFSAGTGQPGPRDASPGRSGGVRSSLAGDARRYLRASAS